MPLCSTPLNDSKQTPRESKPIRVVQFLNGKVRAGAEEVALELARGLDPQAFRSYLVCPPELLEAFGTECRNASLTCVPMTVNSPWPWSSARAFMAFLQAEQIDVVHAHMIRAAFAAIPLARLAHVPVTVHTCHGKEAWRTSRIKGNFWIDRRLAAITDMTIAVSQSTREHLIQDKKLPPERVVVIHNGRSVIGRLPDAARLRQVLAEFKITGEDLIVSVFGRLEEQKGHCYLLEALPTVLRQAPGVKVFFVGDGSLRQALQSQVNAAGLQAAVTFTGYRSDWLDLMSISDLIVLPSLYEGMPLVPIEAAHLGKPVVATAVDGTREVVADGFTGRLVPPANPAALADAISGLLLDPTQMRILGENARARAKSLFTFQRQLQETADLYRQLLALKSR